MYSQEADKDEFKVPEKVGEYMGSVHQDWPEEGKGTFFILTAVSMQVGWGQEVEGVFI